MLDLACVTETAQEVARTVFGAKRVEDVQTQEISDWTGADALEVLIVLDPKAAKQLKGTGKASAMLNGLARQLERQGEQRFAHIRFATQEELDEDDNPDA